MMKRPVPGIGMRMVKSAAAVLICLLVSVAINREDMRIYTSIAALQCIQPYAGETWKMARQRLSGTVVGTAFGALGILLEVSLLDIRGDLAGYVLIALMVVPVLWTAVALGMTNAAYFSCVVFLSITVTHITDLDPWLFVWRRAAETLMGVAVGVGVSACRLPRRRRRDTLFVCGVDGVLLNAEEEMTPYSRVMLNRMLDDGALITIATMRTPASVREATEGLRFRLPIIVMDGAALYDLKQKAYLRSRPLPADLALRCRETFGALGVHCFLNCVLDNILMIYYGDLQNEAERSIYETLRTSPYRNYISASHYGGGEVLYLMAVDRTERIEAVLESLRSSGLADQVKIRFYPSTDYPGYHYLKLYEKDASRQAMLEELKAELGVVKSVTFSSQDGQGDVVLHGPGGNRVVRAIERRYEPFIWEK